MSISTLANAAVARRMDFLPLGGVPQGLTEIAAAATATPIAIVPPPLLLRVQPQQTQPQPSLPANTVNTALHVIFGYIPTEVLTLYVAILAALHQPNKLTSGVWLTFWVFLIATPVVVWLVYAAKVKAAQKPVPIAFSQWPLWEMLAGAVAYFAWAFALPETPFSEFAWYSSSLAGIIVLVASTFLGLLAPFFQNPIIQ